MKTLSGFCVALLVTTGLFAQNRSGFVRSGSITRGAGNVVLPGGTSAMPGIQRTTGNVVYPGGGGLQIGVPNTVPARPNLVAPGSGGGHHRRRSNVYAYPVYVGGNMYGSYYGEPAGYVEPPPPVAGPQQPNVTVIYPPPAAPVIVNQFGPDQYATGPATRIFETPRNQAAAEEPAAEPEYYLIAFKDRSIYSAVAYWVDGETLHYFTAGNKHNQVSVSLVDRELTMKLNSDAGREVKLPPIR
jgi:hypothetical protein